MNTSQKIIIALFLVFVYWLFYGFIEFRNNIEKKKAMQIQTKTHYKIDNELYKVVYFMDCMYLDSHRKILHFDQRCEAERHRKD